MLIVTIHDELKDSNRARAGLERLKASFSLFTQNRQKFPLVYESESCFGRIKVACI